MSHNCEKTFKEIIHNILILISICCLRDSPSQKDVENSKLVMLSTDSKIIDCQSYNTYVKLNEN